MSTTHHLKMAKASQADIDRAIELCHFLNMIRDGIPAADAVEEFELKGYEDLVQRGDACDDDFVLRAHERGGLFRVVWGMQVLLDPANEIVDPDLQHLELHPKRHRPSEIDAKALIQRFRSAVEEAEASGRVIDSQPSRRERACVEFTAAYEALLNALTGGADASGRGGS